jgi:hypothetical protein
MIRTKLSAIAAFVAVVTVSQLAHAQLAVFTPAGVEIDANGVLRARIYNDASGELTRQRIAAARQTLAADLQQPSELRKVSLTRLEREIGRRLADGQPIDEAMRNMAGLTQITHVFFYADTKDIVVAGPAEGFFMDASGRMVGMKSGKAVLQLEDMIAALRAFAPNSPSVQVIGCSIDPTSDGLASFAATVADLSARTQSNQLVVSGNEQAIAETLRQALGKQVVTVQGVPANSHFGQVLVEADYRMKLIGIGVEKPPVKISVWAEHVNPRAVRKNALQRWYFTPDYQRISVNTDETAMQLVGDGVKLIGANERVASDGSRSASTAVDRASSNFTRTFTEKYSQLADKSPVFAQLRNLMDMSIVAAFIKEMDYYGKAGVEMALFNDDSRLPIGTWPAPTHVEPIVNAMYKDGTLATPIGGGVTIQPRIAMLFDNMQVDEEGKVDAARDAVNVQVLSEGQWWWD